MPVPWVVFRLGFNGNGKLQMTISRYRIHIEGRADGIRENFGDDLQVTLSGKETVLEISVPDQSALLGVLRQIRDRALTLNSLWRLTPGTDNPSDGSEKECP